MKNISLQLSIAESPQCHTSLRTSSAKENCHTPTHTLFKGSFHPMTDQYRVERFSSLFQPTRALKGYPAPELLMGLAEDSVGALFQLNLFFILILFFSPTLPSANPRVCCHNQCTDLQLKVHSWKQNCDIN